MLKAVDDRIATSVKKFKDAVSRGTAGSDGAPKSAAASTGGSEKITAPVFEAAQRFSVSCCLLIVSARMGAAPGTRRC